MDVSDEGQMDRSVGFCRCCFGFLVDEVNASHVVTDSEDSGEHDRLIGGSAVCFGSGLQFCGRVDNAVNSAVMINPREAQAFCE